MPTATVLKSRIGLQGIFPLSNLMNVFWRYTQKLPFIYWMNPLCNIKKKQNGAKNWDLNIIRFNGRSDSWQQHWVLANSLVQSSLPFSENKEVQIRTRAKTRSFVRFPLKSSLHLYPVERVLLCRVSSKDLPLSDIS